jgi:hypothetical protein
MHQKVEEGGSQAVRRLLSLLTTKRDLLLKPQLAPTERLTPKRQKVSRVGEDVGLATGTLPWSRRVNCYNHFGKLRTDASPVAQLWHTQ